MSDSAAKGVEYRPGFFLVRRVPVTNQAVQRATVEAMRKARAAARRLRSV